MDVQINELESHVNVVDDSALMSPDALRQIVLAVIAAMRNAQAHDQTRQSELDTRSIVEQQRGGRR